MFVPFLGVCFYLAYCCYNKQINAGILLAIVPDLQTCYVFYFMPCNQPTDVKDMACIRGMYKHSDLISCSYNAQI